MTSTSAGLRFCLPLLALLACQPGASTLNSPVTRANHKFPISAGPHAADCNTCHGAFSSFSQFSCFNCHGHEQPLTDMLHVSLTMSASLPDGGVAYAYDSASCLSCHATGTRVPFDHAGTTGSCLSCHATGAAFAAFPVGGVGLDGGAFTHPPIGSADCGACHSTTTWLGAGKAPTNLASDPSQDVAVAELVPSYCAVCHAPPSKALVATWSTNLAGTTPALFHASLTAAMQPQPASCVDCHANSRPNAVLTSANSTMAAGLAFDHTAGPALGD